MYFAYDSDNNFYYYGEVEPRAGMFGDYLTDTKLIAADVETISLKERIAIGVGIAPNPQVAFYFPLFPEPSSVTPWYLLKDPAITKILQNAPFDLLCLREYEIYNGNIQDTNIMAHLLNIRPSRLVDLISHVALHGGRLLEVHTVPDLLTQYNAKVMLDLPQDVVAKKCMEDCLATFEVYNNLLPHVDRNYFATEMEVIPVLMDMSFRGLLIDQEARAVLEEKLEGEVGYLRELAEEEGFNPASTQQVGYMLAKRGAYGVFPRIPFTRGKRGLNTSVEVLDKMNDPLANLVLEHRVSSKLLGTYIKPWAKEDRATTRYHLDAITGRPSSTDRNMQNIPKGEARNIFIPDNGIFTDLDFNQLELRILAYLSGDKEMQYIYSLPRDDPSADIHQATADFLGIPRRLAKSVNFAMIYGATEETIAETAKVSSTSRARQLKETWFEQYREAGYWITRIQQDALEYPYVETLFGRVIRLPTMDEESVAGIQRKAVNYPIQGSAAEVFKRALIRCKDLPIVLQVHDEMLFEGRVVPPRLDDIAPFQTPVDIRYLSRWE